MWGGGRHTGVVGRREYGGGRGKWGLLFGGRPDNEARGVTQGQDRKGVGITGLDEAGSLVTCAGIDRSAQVGRVVGDQAHGTTFNTDQSRDQAWRKLAAEFQDTVLIGQGFDNLTDIVDPHAVFRK